MVVRISNSCNMDARALAHILHEGYCTNYRLVNLQYIDCFTPLMYGFIMQQYYIIYILYITHFNIIINNILHS